MPKLEPFVDCEPSPRAQLREARRLIVESARQVPELGPQLSPAVSVLDCIEREYAGAPDG